MHLSRWLIKRKGKYDFRFRKYHTSKDMELQDVDLSKKNTFHVGGIAKHYYVPESIEELQECLDKTRKRKSYILSGGSNVLINDKQEFDVVIDMKQIDLSISDLGNGMFYVGASNRIQHVIEYVNQKGYGGIEELVSLPGLFGGIIYMNAGIGGKKDQLFCIADFVKQVKCLDKKEGKIIWLTKEECAYGFRSSVFMNDEYIILGADIQLYKQEYDLSCLRISKRKEYCRTHQEWGKGCFGSCFSKYNKHILKAIRILYYPFHFKVYQSANNSNWLINRGEATFCDAMRIIKMAEIIHKCLHKEITSEVRIWS